MKLNDNLREYLEMEGVDLNKIKTCKEVCPRCEGHGTHLTPSIGNHAYTMEEFNETFWEEEDRAEYFKRGGIYDVICEECKGANVVDVMDEDATPAEIVKLTADYWDDWYETEAMYAAERRMGC